MNNLMLQYILSGLILTIAAIWVIIRLIKLRKSKTAPCNCIGCPIAGKCKSKTNHKQGDNCSGKTDIP